VIGNAIWGDVFWGLIPSLVTLLIILHHQKLDWPILKHRDSYLQTGLIPLLLFASLWLVVSFSMEGRPRPLSYFPVANPLELSQLFILFVLVVWLIRIHRDDLPQLPSLQGLTVLYIVAGLAFIWLNSVVGRAVHFFYGVRFNMDALFNSAIYQASISIIWTLTALTMTAVATRHNKRKLWFVGAILIAAVALKLFAIDLKDTGTIERIISFLTVGILLSVIGYLSPLPPKESIEDESADESD
ncbi:MAG: putative membrane protein, partial [Gammaproteobacteria bacterium]